MVRFTKGGTMKMRLSMWAACVVASLLAAGCTTPMEHNLPPADQLARLGPGMAGPGPGVM